MGHSSMYSGSYHSILFVFVLCDFLFFSGSQAQTGIGLKVTQREVSTILGDAAIFPATYNTRSKIISLTWFKVAEKDNSARKVVYVYNPASSVRKAYKPYEGRAQLDDSASLRIDPTKPGDDGKYVLTVMSEFGSDEAFVQLTLMVRPVVDVGPANPYAVMRGKSVTLTCSVRNAKPNITSLSWLKDNESIDSMRGMDVKYSGGTTDSPFLTINNVMRKDAGIYRCSVEHRVQRTGAELRLDVLYPASIISMSKSQDVWVSDHVTLQCMADGNPPPNITWTRGGLVMPSKIHPIPNYGRACSVTIRNIQTNDTGTYLCTANNGVGESDIKSVDLSVKARRRGTPSSTLAIIVAATAGALWLIICVGLSVYILLRRRKEKEKKKFAFYYNMGRRDPPAGSSPKRDEDGEPPPYAALPAKPVGSKAARAGINTMRRTAELKAGRRYAKVLYTYAPREENELPLEVDDVIEVLEGEDGGWCLGYLRGRIGLFPSNYVRFIPERKVPVLRHSAELEERQMKRSV